MKNRKLKNYLKLGILLFVVSFLLENCENNNEETIHLDFENSENLNLKTVSFQDAKNFFNVKIEEVKEERKLYARKGGKAPLELTPNWNSIKHDELYGIEQAQLTLADVDINRSGDYISKLFFVNRNDKMESIIFTIFQEEVDKDGTIIEAQMFFNELNGDFIDGYRIEDGKITKKIIVVKKPNVQKASMFMFFQEKEYWTTDCLEGGGTNEIIVNATPFPGIRPGPTSHGISGFTNINVYSTGNPSTSSNYTSGGGVSGITSVTSVAGSLYAHAINERELADGEEEQIINKLTGKAKCVYDKLEGNDLRNKTIQRFDGEKAPVHLILELTDISDPNVGGETDYGNSYNITISLDNDYMNNTPSLFVALIILHEAIHADIYSKIKTRGGLYYNSSTFTWELNGEAANFPTLFDYYNNYPNNPHHNFMADYYREAMEKGLKDYANANGLNYPNQLYKDLAWAGLQGTDSWSNMFADPAYTASEQKRIIKAINDFKNSGTNECN